MNQNNQAKKIAIVTTSTHTHVCQLDKAPTPSQVAFALLRLFDPPDHNNHKFIVLNELTRTSGAKDVWLHCFSYDESGVVFIHVSCAGKLNLGLIIPKGLEPCITRFLSENYGYEENVEYNQI